MANRKLSELTAILANALADGDLFPVVDVSAGSTKVLTKAQLASLFDAAGAATAAQAASQPLDSDLTAIAALSTTSFGRAVLTLADAAAGRSAFGAEVAGAAAAAQAASQPLDADLTAIAALSTTPYGRSLLTLANVGALATSLAADPAFSGRYAPLSVQADTEAIWIGPSEFITSFGSPSFPGSQLVPVITLDPTSIEIIEASFRTPASWVTATVSLWYYTGSASGDIVINPRVYMAGSGESAAPSATSGITSSITIPGSTAAIVNIQSCGTFTCQPAKACAFWLQRNATAGGDTNAADLAVIGVSIAKAS